MLFGAAGVLFPSFLLMITLLQRVMMAMGPPPPGDFQQWMDTLHRVWWIHVPAWVAGGLWFLWWGRALRRDHVRAPEMLRLACRLALLGEALYFLHLAWVFPPAIDAFVAGMPEEIRPPFSLALPMMLATLPMLVATGVPFVLLHNKLPRSPEDAPGETATSRDD